MQKIRAQSICSRIHLEGLGSGGFHIVGLDRGGFHVVGHGSE